MGMKKRVRAVETVLLLLFRIDPLPCISYSLGRADMHILTLTFGCVVMHAFGSSLPEACFFLAHPTQRCTPL